MNSRWIDPNPGSLLSMYMDVDGCQNDSANTVNYVEHVQCRISLKFFPRGDLRIVLTSPMGTESVLLFERPLDIISSTFDDWPFLSVHYWGEKIVGRWQLKITRRMANSTAKSPGNGYLCNLILPTIPSMNNSTITFNQVYCINYKNSIQLQTERSNWLRISGTDVGYVYFQKCSIKLPRRHLFK